MKISSIFIAICWFGEVEGLISLLNKNRLFSTSLYSYNSEPSASVVSSSYEDEEDEINVWRNYEASAEKRRLEIDELLLEKESEDEEMTGEEVKKSEMNSLIDDEKFERAKKAIKSEGISMSLLDEDPLIVDSSIDEESKERKGISVGSAGGWSLEVFQGDYVVHRKYGIGEFRGIQILSKTKLTPEELEAQRRRRTKIIKDNRKRGATNEEIEKLVSAFGTDEDLDVVSNPRLTLLEIRYADGTVTVPIERSYRLTRYRSSLDNVRLSRVKGESWAKAKSRVAESTLTLAQDVLALYAKRETLERAPYPPQNEVLLKEFNEAFEYEPTPDQLTCFEAIMNDMVYRKRPMDRLICGDVGFGKTEVALRAAYRCLLDGRQVAFLSPTGVLASQHYRTVQNRFLPFNVTVGFLRGGMGNNTKVGRQIRDELSNGSMQLVIGTHALLGKSLKFKNLGLLVIDEEQRFGVQQKERLKVICNGIDVLTLTATPIPRTLQMSLSGIRETSIIRSPPPMRKPIITQIAPYQESIIYDAIKLELERGGQCFYVVPRISQIEEASETIKRLFPNIRLVQAHGRMQKRAEENVAFFTEEKADILLATTVIENGVDIPTVNTIIVQNAQTFGMSTLYQLRGRVGRSDVQAFSYFLHKDEILSEQSNARLQAIAMYHSLGSGFDIASRDLQIRGAGSILGTQQSGLVARVGFDLYMKMLKKSVRQLLGLLDLPIVPRTNVLLPLQEPIDSFSIPEHYIKDPSKRKYYTAEARLAQTTDKIVELTKIWKQEYGPLPSSLQANLKTLHLHACTRILGIDLVGLSPQDQSMILRTPGLRPRHWAMICSSLKNISPKGFNVVFPARFFGNEKSMEIVGGSKVDSKAMLNDSSSKKTDDDDDWDAFDLEEEESLKEVSSPMNVVNIDNVEISQYPRFIIPLSFVKNDKYVDTILKLLLPIVQVIVKVQNQNKEKATLAVELRDKRKAMKLKLQRQKRFYHTLS